MPAEHESVVARQAAAGLLAADALARFGRVRFRANGTSMTPAIWPGDIVEVRAVSPAQVDAGDVVLVRRDSRLFVHRLVAADIPGDRFTTKGDAHDACDPAVSASSVLGLVMRVKRGPFTLDPRLSPHAGWRAAHAVVDAMRRLRHGVARSVGSRARIS